MPKTGTTAARSPNKKKGANDGNGAAAKISNMPAGGASSGANGEALEIKDSRNNKTYSVPIADCAIRALATPGSR